MKNKLRAEVFQNCWKCRGKRFIRGYLCDACGGSGKLDWLSNFLRKEGGYKIWVAMLDREIVPPFKIHHIF